MTDTDHPAPATPHAVAAAGRIIPDIEHTGDTAGLRRLLREAHNRNRELADALEQAQADTARLQRKADSHDAAKRYVLGRRGMQPIIYDDGTFGNLSALIVRLEEVVRRDALAHREADAT